MGEKEKEAKNYLIGIGYSSVTLLAAIIASAYILLTSIHEIRFTTPHGVEVVITLPEDSSVPVSATVAIIGLLMRMKPRKTGKLLPYSKIIESIGTMTLSKGVVFLGELHDDLEDYVEERRKKESESTEE